MEKRKVNGSDLIALGYEPGAWFTPAIEVDLCGHATLASAYVLFKEPISLYFVIFMFCCCLLGYFIKFFFSISGNED